MISLLFALFLVCMILALSNKEKLCFTMYGIALVASVLWFLHHATTPLTIQL